MTTKASQKYPGHKYLQKTILIIVLCLWCVTVAAGEVMEPVIIGDAVISVPTHDITPIYDGKEIVPIEGVLTVSFLRTFLLADFYGLFADTPLKDSINAVLPAMFTLLGGFTVFRFVSTKKRKSSPLPEKILRLVTENPGSSQKQIIETVGVSRGSACHHLHNLERDLKIYKISAGNSVLYYSYDIISDNFEQEILILISQEKSHKFFRALYHHPNSTRRELADLLGISGSTLRWYFLRFSDEKILQITRDEKIYRYALTEETRKVYEKLICKTSGNFSSETFVRS